jgi:hypothetical protein
VKKVQNFLQRDVENCIACRITREHPDYNAYNNNCQKFVVYLLKVACPGCAHPKTINEAVTSLITYVKGGPAGKSPFSKL